MDRRRNGLVDGFNELLCAWLQNGYKNSENTEKKDVFRKSNDRKLRKHAICQTRFFQPNP